MIKKIKKSNIFYFILGATIFSVIGVAAVNGIYSKDVTYDNTNSGLSSTTVQGALDELYEKTKNVPSCDDNGNCTVTCPDEEEIISISKGYKCSKTTAKKTIKKLNVTTVTSGDGLYVDTVTSGRYFYRGENVDNYIVFNNELWRIMSIESDGTLKIIRNDQLDDTYKWDTAENRGKTVDGEYCYTSPVGACDAWAATSNLVGTPSSLTKYSPDGKIFTGTVTQDASLNTILNETYYDSLSDDYKSKVVKGTFNVSTPGTTIDTETLETDAEQEKQYQWKGYVALYTATELLRASTTSGCSSLSAGYNSESTGYCNSNNWLWPMFNNTEYEWTLSPFDTAMNFLVWAVKASSNQMFSQIVDEEDGGVRPVLHLSGDIQLLSGNGTDSDPYVIE